MKNDFDFIKDRIDQSNVGAPSDMDREYVMRTLEDVYPKPVALKPRRSRIKTVAASIAAAVVLVSAVSTALYIQFGSGGERQLALPGGLSLRQFSSRDEVKGAVKELRERNNSSDLLEYINDIGSYLTGDYAVAEDYADTSRKNVSDEAAFASGSSTGSTNASSGSDSFSETYKQVEGVDEADIIKTDGRYIYCVSNQTIRIFTAGGERAELAAEIDISKMQEATADEIDYRWYAASNLDLSEIYIRDSLLIAVSNVYSGSCYTVASVYDVSDIDNITLTDIFTQSGSCSASRMIGDTLYTVSSFYPYDDEMIPVCGTGASPDELPADSIYSLCEPVSESFLVVGAYDTLSHTAQTESKAIFGGAEDIYCNENNMYIYTTEWRYDEGWFKDTSTSAVSSQILKIDLTDGIAFTAYTEVEGRIYGRYALDEYDGNLRVATTTNIDGVDENNLYVFDEDLDRIGSVTGFAEDESIKAVRYLGDTAYVITYVQTDPLFVIDLSEPSDPTILGEVEISGFSTMLIPIGDDTLLGIGYGTEDEAGFVRTGGLKLALFDVSDKTAPKVLDSMVYDDCSSPVQYDPRALVVNPDRGDFVIPLNYYHYQYDDLDYGYYDDAEYYQPYDYKEEMYGGMLNFAVRDGRLVETARYNSALADSVERCVYVGDTVYMAYYDTDAYSFGDEINIESVPYQ